MRDRGFVIAWDAASLQVRGVVETPWPVYGVDSTGDGTHAVVLGGAGWAVLDLARFTLGPEADLERWTRIGTGTSLAEVAPDGDRAGLLVGGRVILVDLASVEVLEERVIETGAAGFAQSAAWTADGSALAVGTTNGWFHVLDGSTLASVAPRRLVTSGMLSDVEVSPDGEMAATIGPEGDVTLWDTASWRPNGQPLFDDRTVGFLRFTPTASAWRSASTTALSATSPGIPPRGWRPRVESRRATSLPTNGPSYGPASRRAARVTAPRPADDRLSPASTQRVARDRPTSRGEVMNRHTTVGVACAVLVYAGAVVSPLAVRSSATDAPRLGVNHVLFHSLRGGNDDIYVVSPDGGEERRLTDDPANDMAPQASPDRRRIAFASDREGQMQIYVMNADGTGQRNIGSSTSFDFHPRWPVAPGCCSSDSRRAARLTCGRWPRTEAASSG